KCQVLIQMDQEQAVVVELYAIDGRSLQRSTHYGQQIEVFFDLNEESSGIFLISVQTAQGRVSKPLILKR
ncbi:MAG: T9SS C-terminal target domain-containing protein, partial [Bacteroidetes bacterium]